jgi:nucleoside recognition membrane protein YjiH
MSNKSASNTKPTGVHMLKFVIISIIGIFLFMVPLNLTSLFGWELTQTDRYNILLGHLIDIIRFDVFDTIYFSHYATETYNNPFSMHYILALILITISFIGTLITKIAKPKFIMENDTLRNAFDSSILYVITKAVGAILIWMVFLRIGPAAIIDDWDVTAIVGLVAVLVIIFLVLLPFMPLITDFGLMDFIGILIKRVVRVLFTLPGRASVDLMASWFGSSVVSIIITRGQHERGFYTGREAAVIAVNFSFVSLPFTYVVADMMGIAEHFLWFYLIMCLTCVILGFILPRIWPQKQLPDTYLEEVGKQSIEDDKPAGMSNFTYAIENAAKKAQTARVGDIVKSAGKGWLNVYMDLLPTVMAWGTLAVLFALYTPVLNWISWPFGQYMRLLQIEGAMEVAPLALVGFIDMLLPAIMISNDMPLMTLFVIGILSIVQIIYLAETGVLIIRSKMPLGIGKLAIIFLMRTILGLPIIVGLTHLFSLIIPNFPI